MTEKKSERLEVRLGYQEKSEFVEACETQGDTPSSALRRFIRGYVRRADADLLASAWRGLGRGWKVTLGIGGSIAALLLAGLVIFPKADISASNQHIAEAMKTYGPLIDNNAVPPVNNNPKDPGPALHPVIFAKYDHNTDGIIKLGEILPNDIALHRVLDLDGNGITIDEFFKKGRMDYKIAQGYKTASEDGFPTITVTTRETSVAGRLIKSDPRPIRRMVEFDLTGTVPIINSFEVDPSAVRLSTDRTVYWEEGETKIFSLFSNHDYRVRSVSD